MIYKDLVLKEQDSDDTIDFSICPFFDELQIECNDKLRDLRIYQTFNKEQTENLILFLINNLEHLK